MAEQSQSVLPPERPFAGDDLDTLELMHRNAVDFVRRRRRRRRVGVVVVVAIAVSAGQPVIEHAAGVFR